MEPRYYDASGHIDYELVKAYAVELRAQAVESAWRQLVSNVSGWVAGLRLDATAHSPRPGAAHFGHARHRTG